MIRWTAKNPEEVLDYYWQPPLDPGDAIASFEIERAAGAVAVDSSDFTDAKARTWLSGGAAGETAVFELIVVTDEGRTFKETARVDVVSSAIEDPQPLAKLQAWRASLFEARMQGVRSFADQNGERIEYSSDREMAAALGAVDREIQALTAPRAPSTIIFQTSKGL